MEYINLEKLIKEIEKKLDGEERKEFYTYLDKTIIRVAD